MSNPSQQPAAGAWQSLPGTRAPAPGDLPEESTREVPVVPAPGFTRPSSPLGGTTASDAITVVSPPVVILYGSLAASLVGIALAALGASLVLGVLSWSLSALVGLGLAVLFLLRDSARQTLPFYARTPATAHLYRASVAVALLGITAAAVRIAFIAGRM